jgi:hypothetical protein
LLSNEETTSETKAAVSLDSVVLIGCAGAAVSFDCSLSPSYFFLNFSNAFNTEHQREIATGLRRVDPSLYRAGRWAYRSPSDLPLASRDTEITHSLSLAQEMRQGGPLGPPMLALGIWALLDDSSTTHDPQLILAYLDDIYSLSNNPNAGRNCQPCSLRASLLCNSNMAKSKTVTLQKASETGLHLLGSCIRPAVPRNRFLGPMITAEEARTSTSPSSPSPPKSPKPPRCLWLPGEDSAAERTTQLVY